MLYRSNNTENEFLYSIVFHHPHYEKRYFQHFRAVIRHDLSYQAVASRTNSRVPEVPTIRLVVFRNCWNDYNAG